MERLTNIGSNGEIWITDNDDTRRFGRKESAYKKLAEYEDLEEQGLLLRLPCKVGDTIYHIMNVDDELKIREMKIATLNNLVAIMECGDIGKTVFLTPEEAEQKLKEMESD